MEEYLANSNFQIIDVKENEVNLYCKHCELDIQLVKRTLRDAIRLKRNPDELCNSCKRCNQVNVNFENTGIHVKQSTSKQVIVECKKCDTIQTMHRASFDRKLKLCNFKSWCTTCSKLSFDNDRIEEFKQEMKRLYNHNVVKHNPTTREIIYTCGNCGNDNNKSFTSNLKRDGYTGCCPKCLNDKNRNDFDYVCKVVEEAGHIIAMNKEDYKSNKKVAFYCKCGNPDIETTSLHRLSTDSGCLKCSKTRALETIKEQYNCKDLGITNVFQIPDIKEKSKETNLEKYGVEYPLQCEKMFSKMMQSSFKTKKYKFPSGRIVKIQGYEHRAIDLLLSENFVCPFIAYKITEDMIVVGEEMKSFNYTFNNCIRRYYPDIHIKNTNVYIEVKSEYLLKKDYEQNMAKFNSFINRDERLVVLVFDKKNLIEILKF